jgi:predicted short-subunit dehydrogenase-like oxidoreductase (DUF2520 family)
MSQPSVTIIGTGALGAALAKALHENNYSITSLFNRRFRKAEALSREVETQYCSEFPESTQELGSIVFITVRDSEIKNVAQNLGRITDDFTGYTIVHCSGSKAADVLRPVQTKGARIAAFHPLQTFTHGSGARDFRNIYFDVEADEETLNLLNDLANSLGAQTIEISAEAKPYLHAAAVIASNYLVTLLNLSGKTAGLGGLDSDEALQALLPLVKNTLQNVESKGTFKALTGPIKRGDAETVRLHLDLLSGNKNLLNVYKKLGLETLNIAVKGELISHQKQREINELLKDYE